MNFQYEHTSIFYEIKGKGPTLLFLHGFLESSTMWNGIKEEFEASHQVVTIDLPGHGKSGVVDVTHSMDLMADIVVELLKHLKIKAAICVGHSMGGYVLMSIAERHPGFIKKLILMNSTPEADSAERKENRERAITLIPKAKDAFISMAITNLFSESSKNSFQNDIEMLKNEAFTYPLEGIIAAIRGMKEKSDKSDVLRKFPREKWMILAEDDPIIPLSEALRVAKATNTSIKIVPGGHMSYIEMRDEIVKILHLIVISCI